MAEVRHHISSAVIVTRASDEASVLAVLKTEPNVEVHAHERGKIVVVIEGASTGELGACLQRISQLSGVVTANMVFEHVLTEGTCSDDCRTDAA
ncbi:chaperone NapD [Rhizobium sp. BK251]|uniref:chaperone NapD n=1 Tax=Rhizobium sp. BK251 TaxID=2512125 RepID=UPI001052217B|nr:chaperone NapD [Rhizobium sp. BK251]TCL70579.1 periplasmic nitrate reductase chaperone NapD [Rhizobium sp. BK251]